jgi:nucleotide-binding universal stress UspA family protein
VSAHDGPVVIGYDGGPGAADALALGIGWAGQLGTPSVVLTVYPGPAPISPGRVDAEWVADRRAEAENLLDEARGLATETNVEFRAVGSGSASHGLHDLAEELEASLIVLGSPQRPQPPLLTATTGDRVIAGASCPVSIPPRGWRDRPARGLGRIGVAFVPTPDGREALRTAAVFARRVDAQLHVVTVVADEAEVMSYRIGQDAEQKRLSAWGTPHSKPSSWAHADTGRSVAYCSAAYRRGSCASSTYRPLSYPALAESSKLDC